MAVTFKIFVMLPCPFTPQKVDRGILKKEPNNRLLLPRSVPRGTLQIIETFFILTIIIKTSRWRQ